MMSWQQLAVVPSGHRTYDDFITGNDLPPDEYLTIEYRIYARNQNVASNHVLDTGSLYSGIFSEGIVADADRLLGIDVDIDGEWAVAGTRGLGFNIYHLNDDNTWSLDTAIGLPFLSITSSSALFGEEVAISGKYIAVSASRENSLQGSVYVFENKNGKWQFMQIVREEAPAERIYFGQALDIYDNTSLGGKDYLVISNRGEFIDGRLSDYRGEVMVYQRLGSEWENYSRSYNYWSSRPSENRLRCECIRRQIGCNRKSSCPPTVYHRSKCSSTGTEHCAS